MVDKVCKHCGEAIYTERDLFVLLGTYEGERFVSEDYFHMICWRRYFEECARKKAEAVVNSMQERMMPIAKQMADKLKEVIGQQ